MISSQELYQSFPVIAGILDVVGIALFVVLVWLFARMGDNVNKIRRMLEEEIRNRRSA